MSQPRFCYLDNNATTRVAPEVVEAMLPFLTTHWGNPSSAYSFGSRLIKDIQEAHAKVAALINADPKEIIFTSCGTESSNAALHSALTLQPQKRHVLTTTVEHSATMKYGRYLQNRGFEVTYLPVEPDGSLDLHLLDQSIRPDTAIVSVMWANNETGILFPIEEIAAICRSKGVHFHTDAVQAAGKVKVDVKAAGVDLLSLSAHKIHAPKGIGALYVRREVPFQPYILGGNQEAGRRAGTENVPYMVAYGRAAELAWGRLADADTRVRQLRDRMEQGILRSVPNTMRNGAPEPRLPNTANITFDLVEAEAVLAGLDQLGICVSSGSACTTGSLAPSHVLTAMGLSPARARGAIRFSLGYENTDADVDYLLKHLPPLIARVREAPTKSASARDQEEPPTATVSENVVVSKAGALLTP